MIIEEFSVEPATWSADSADLRAVRNEVFVLEQGVPEDEEWDELDARSQHVVARDRDGRAIGTGRLTPLRTIGRMAIVRDWRGRGVGAAILRVLVERARELHYDAVELHSQTHAITFYAQAGFVAHGDEYDECGIAHRNMRLELEPLPLRPPAPLAAESAVEAWTSATRDEARIATLGVLASARREVAILTRDLDPDLFDHADVLDALKRVALERPNAHIRFLVYEPARAGMLAHRVIALAQRLSSVFAMRTPVEEVDRQFAGAFIVNDHDGYFERALASRFEGEGNRHAPPRAAQLLSQFNQVWERSVPAEELRRLEL